MPINRAESITKYVLVVLYWLCVDFSIYYTENNVRRILMQNYIPLPINFLHCYVKVYELDS